MDIMFVYDGEDVEEEASYVAELLGALTRPKGNRVYIFKMATSSVKCGLIQSMMYIVNVEKH